MEGGGYVFFAKYTLNLPYFCPKFSSKKNPIFLYDFCQRWLDTMCYFQKYFSFIMAVKWIS